MQISGILIAAIGAVMILYTEKKESSTMATNWTVPSYDKPLTTQRFWLPEIPGESLMGVYLGTAIEQGKFGPEVLMGLRSGGTERVVRVQQSLDEQLLKHKPQRGHGIAIRYDGKDVNGKRGRQFTLKLFPKLDDASLLSGSELRADEVFADAPAPAAQPGAGAPENAGASADDELPF